MTKSRAMYRFYREDVIAAVRDVTGKEPLIFECNCGCEAIVAYAMGTAPTDKTAPVLWLLSQFAPKPSMVVAGLESIRETREFLANITRFHPVAGPKLEVLFLEAWAGALN